MTHPAYKEKMKMNKPVILGGTPIFEKMPDYTAWPRGGEAELEAILRTLRSGKWGTEGEESENFAAAYAKYCHAAYALPVLNGTVSLELIFRALGVGYGDEVILPPYTFCASAHAVILSGAYPVFADIDPDTFTLSPASVENCITPRTKAILAVHLGGRPCDMDALGAIAKKHGLYLIEDAAHAHGSEWRGKRTGSLGTAGSFSFQASKNISCGEGGAITTDDPLLFEKLRQFAGANAEDGSFVFPATKALLPQWQCALLLARMQRLDGDIEKRMENAAYLDRELGKLPFYLPLKQDERITRNSLHLYCFRYLEEEISGLPRALFLKAMRAEMEYQVGSGYSSPLYQMEMFETEDFARLTGKTFADPSASLPGNELIARKEGCWMSHSTLLGPKSDMDKIVEIFARIAAFADEIKKAEEKKA